MTSGPLGDVTVVDLTRALAGPHAAMMLGDLGARVIKVETPGHGDDTRGWGPPFVAPPAFDQTTSAEPISTYFLSCNRNKKSIAIDLKSATGREALTEMIRRADVLLENFRPGVMDRLGFAMTQLAELNPRLVILSISGFGHDGPEASRAGYDQIAQGEAGLMSMTGSDPDNLSKVGVPISDLLAGMYGAYGVLAALHERQRTGLGGVVRTSLLASVIGVHAYQGTRWTVAGEIPQAEGPHHPSICPYGLFHTADGAVQIAVGSEQLWARFADEFNLPTTGEFATNPDRVRNSAVVRAAIDNALSQYTTDQALQRLRHIGTPSGEVKSLQQVYDWEQTRSQGLVIAVEHPQLGRIELPGPPLRFFDNTGQEWQHQHTAPPILGQHTDEIADWLATPANYKVTDRPTPPGSVADHIEFSAAR